MRKRKIVIQETSAGVLTMEVMEVVQVECPCGTHTDTFQTPSELRLSDLGKVHLALNAIGHRPLRDRGLLLH